MSIKLIAIGNRLMGDDAIAINIAERLDKIINYKILDVIIGETDFQYCLSKIEEGDYIIILDCTWLGVKPGTITMNSLKDINMINCNNSSLSQHSYSLNGMIESFYKDIDGIVIGIEGSNFDFSLSMSRELEDGLEEISMEVEKIIMSLLAKK